MNNWNLWKDEEERGEGGIEKEMERIKGKGGESGEEEKKINEKEN